MVYDNDRFKVWAKQTVVLVKLDFPRQKKLPADLKKQNDALKQKYEVGGYPSIYFVKANEEQIGPRFGLIAGGIDAWLDGAKQILK